MTSDPRLKSFSDGDALADALAVSVADRLTAACRDHGEAVIAVSGGSTPARFFRRLSEKDVPWSKVTVTLVDERFVAPDSDRSNQKLVSDTLLQNRAAQAGFVGLYNPAADIAAGAKAAAEAIGRIRRPFDVVILGMGNDGHTASFFPGGDRLADAIAADQQAPVLPMQASGAEEPRLTLTLPLIVSAGLVVLHIEGDGKMTTLDRALGEGRTEEMPIRAVLRHEPVNLEIFWAP
ncbi:6-phosphogluconolactonase [Phyllobacterium sp. 0TCS1.6C]|uniref:6-phosphogluconolactonase n=1 Tax=unclassified Phyllobacterium TaxID=2638441 RepID=UPI002264D639|nr:MULTISPECIES: 6-phosphogluconolactonase [unclassified Phyllobacterium]MCX8281246.1 6-phosphogluconolactonase [Phyllobacterium sp. 0TCS1.6C]MCX8294468.1 6-phosphogluconolactonase [Phyllobacterium sp. 0TCS1.6A]